MMNCRLVQDKLCLWSMATEIGFSPLKTLNLINTGLKQQTQASFTLFHSWHCFLFLHRLLAWLTCQVGRITGQGKEKMYQKWKKCLYTIYAVWTNLSNGAPSVRDWRIWMDPGPWDAFSDTSALNSRNSSCKDQREKKR